MFYDLVFDRDLIEASFAMQYGIRLSCEDLAFGEYCRLLRGLMTDTPLGRVVAVRAEKDRARIEGFGAGEREIRRVWLEFCGRREGFGDVGDLQRRLALMFGERRKD